MLTGVVNAYPEIMKVAGDLVIGSMDMAGADVLAKRLKALLPPGIGDDEAVKLQQLQQALTENAELKQAVSDMEKILAAEREKAQAEILKQQMENQGKLQQLEANSRSELLQQQINDQTALSVATIKARVDLETNTQNNIVKVIIERIKSRAAVDIAVIKTFTESAQLPTHEERMGGYMSVVDELARTPEPEPAPVGTPAGAPAPGPTTRRGWQVVRDENGDMAQIMPFEVEE